MTDTNEGDALWETGQASFGKTLDEAVSRFAKKEGVA